MAREKVAERVDHRRAKPRTETRPRGGRAAGSEASGTGIERAEQRGQDRQSGKAIGGRPAEVEALWRCQRDRPDARDQIARPVSELVHSGAVRQLGLAQYFDAIGINDDVLRRRQEGTRKSGVWGKSVSVRVDLGGRR